MVRITGLFKVVKEPYVTFDKKGIVCFLKPETGGWSTSVMEVYATFPRESGIEKGDVLFVEATPYPVKRDGRTKLRLDAPVNYEKVEGVSGGEDARRKAIDILERYESTTSP